MMRIQEYDCPQENVWIDIHEGYVSFDRKKVLQAQIITHKKRKIITSIMCVMLFYSLSIFTSQRPFKANSVYGSQCLCVCCLPTAANYKSINKMRNFA